MTPSYNNTSTIKTVKAAYGLWKETINGEVGYQSENFGAGVRWFVRQNPRYKQGTKTPQLELCIMSTDRVASTTTVEGPEIDFTPAQPEQPVSEPITDAQEVTEPEVSEPAPAAKEETPKPSKRSGKKTQVVNDPVAVAALVPDTDEIPF
tara:strand:+ start:263 stop:712 length:450 start_codon:yes stop_codon:yes gene_type:complete